MTVQRLLVSCVLIVLCSPQAPAKAVWGVPDNVPAATLLVPFFEVGIDIGVNPHDTLPVVFNGGVEPVTIHWEIWSVDGEQSGGLFGNEGLPNGGSWSGSFRNIINQASNSDKALLDQGDGFYRGFMTIDVVTSSTSTPPFDDDYPFSFANVLSGVIYYARFLDGSSNALAAVPIEAVSQNTSLPGHDFFDGFYGTRHGFREEIDANARDCVVSRLNDEQNCPTGGRIDEIHARVVRRDADSSNTRLVVFAWNTVRPDEGGPSAICDGLGCATEYLFRRTTQDGTVTAQATTRLDHVVNIIRPPEAAADPFGDYKLFNIPNASSATQVYAFVIQSAQPPEFPGFNWDAIFEAAVRP